MEVHNFEILLINIIMFYLKHVQKVVNNVIIKK